MPHSSTLAKVLSKNPPRIVNPCIAPKSSARVLTSLENLRMMEEKERKKKKKLEKKERRKLEREKKKLLKLIKNNSVSDMMHAQYIFISYRHKQTKKISSS